VIAYATASTPQGPYTYKGIIACGSTTEWTNQATIMKVDNATGSTPWMMVYHDSPADIKERKLHAECLFAGNGTIAGVYRQPLTNANGFNACMAGTNFNYSGYGVSHSGGAGNQPLMMSAPGGGGQTLNVSRTAVGPWERFREVSLSNGKVAYQSLANNKYVCAGAVFGDAYYLQPACTSSSDSTAQFTKLTGNDGRFRLRAANNYWVSQVSYADGYYKLGLWPSEAFTAYFTEYHLR
jgi:hypothetical protein